ncbi:1-deoxy-D-xylulose-5-phosphate synthase [Streptomyces sp. RFCAC02]|uniref:1-deoxy-D-xylulose-5-phosphate synthase n=1 Tax=Streptomyces sp. RFCAC02 TaxID=2499143 RepID=UPI00101F4DC1|nr:1-deoxy-D-xylulose-5-phosphate synthase [Streptomyces sp. RFCAC02]
MTALDAWTPDGLRRLDPEELPGTAARMRELLVRSVSANGGHLGSNLGVVELTIALHRVFRSPDDVILWDTGHQAYVHKMVTGRAGAFGSLRALDGLSGYPSRAESPHDWVENSHAGTSLSYAAGLATAFAARPAGRRRRVVSVTGDGSLTTGMALEALNDIGDRGLDVTIVLNDNARSYAPTTGALARHLREFEAGVAPGVFEALGIRYLGPVDGHDASALEKVLADARAERGPLLVHVRTRKGHGYRPAAEDRTEHMHGVGPFDAATGRQYALPPGRVPAGSVLGPALVELADADPDLVVITPAMGGPSGLDVFQERHPGRFHDVGIAEQHAAGLAAGLAMAGRRPVLSIHSSFLNRAQDQLLFDIGLHRLPVVVVIDRAGITGGDGASHHGLGDLALLRQIPGMAIATPSTAAELRGLLKAAVRHPGPVAIRHGKAIDDSGPPGDGGDGDADMTAWPVEPAPGGVLVIGAGDLLACATEVAARLRAAGVPAGPANARWIEPLDERLPALAAEHRLVAVIEDHWSRGGLGSAVRERLADEDVATPVRVFAVPHDYLPHGSVPELRAACGLTPERITADLLARWTAQSAGAPRPRG